MSERIIFHVDVNNAFLSWSAVYLLQKGYSTDIRTIPSIIGGDEKTRHGIVLAKSPVAKKYGIVTAETIYQARTKCPTLQVYPPNFEFYYQKSKELMTYLKNYTPVLEQFSIDECFMDMTGTNYLYKNYLELAHKIKDEIFQKFGYTVNVGIGNNKLCAKMASDFEKPNKVHTLLKNEIQTKLWPLPVGDLFMCGKKTTQTLNSMNIFTIKDLAKTDTKILEKKFKSQGKYLKEAALGIDTTPVISKKERSQSISTTETLPHDEDNENNLKEILLRQVEDVTRQLRKKELFATTVAIIYKDSNFKNYSFQTKLSNPTSNTKEILNIILKLFTETYKNTSIRLIGVRLSNLTNTKQKQITLFDKEQETETEDNFQTMIDQINEKFGSTLIAPASMKKITNNKKAEHKNQ